MTHPSLSRRGLLRGALAALAVPALARAAPRALDATLTAAVSQVSLVGPNYPSTTLRTYDGVSPGPALRVPVGERLQVELRNALAQPTTVHWHGVRLANAMDGVPGLTQAPVAPGAAFSYDSVAPDAGTYWYHSHVRSFEQVGRGLYGPLIVEERAPYRVDRELLWVLDDWRLNRKAALSRVVEVV